MADLLRQQSGYLAPLAYLDIAQLRVMETLVEKPQGQASLVVSGVDIYLPLADLVDVEDERARLQKELDGISAQITRLDGLLAGGFVEKAPAPVVDKERQRLSTYRTAAKLRTQLAGLVD